MAAISAAVLIAGCGGGGQDQAVGYTVDSGAAQKGPLAQGSAVFVNELSGVTFQPNGKGYTFSTVDNLGAFSTAGIRFGTAYLSTLASGYYFNEITGAQSTDIVNLRGLSHVGTGYDTVINVNALSSMAVNRIIKLATVAPKLSFAVARAQAQRELLAAFYIYNGTAVLNGATVAGVAQPANLTALDLSKGRAGDQILAAMSGVVMTAGANGNGVNTLLSQIAVDLGDDGLLNNSPNYTLNVQSILCAAAATTDYSVVAANLNRVYGTKYVAADLSQWVDTSGCVDQVINKYKFKATNVAAGTESKSVAYIAGPDDAGQCFSVGGMSSGATAKLYYKGSSTAVVGTQKVNLGDSVIVGITVDSGVTASAFVQRSAPSASGVCPTAVPVSGLVRVMNYTVSGSATYTIGGTVIGLGDGQSVTLRNNGGNATTVTANGAFTFTPALVQGSAYSISAGTQSSGQICDVTNGNGIATSAVSNVNVSCRLPVYMVSTFAGNLPGNADGAGAAARFEYPAGVAVDASGWIYVADTNNHQIRKISPSGLVSTLAGTGRPGYQDGDAASASFYYPRGVAVDSNGWVYVADTNNSMIRKISPTGAVSTLAGSQMVGFSDATGRNAIFANPTGVAVDANGWVYVADTYNNMIRKISPLGVVSTLAGRGPAGSADGPTATARFSEPFGVAVDESGNIYVADTGNRKIRKITVAGEVSTLADSTGCSNEDSSIPWRYGSVSFCAPRGVSADRSGNIYIADYGNHKIRKINLAGLVSTVAGSDNGIGSLDGAATSLGASFSNPVGIALDINGNIYIADSGNHKIRKITSQ